MVTAPPSTARKPRIQRGFRRFSARRERRSPSWSSCGRGAPRSRAKVPIGFQFARAAHPNPPGQCAAWPSAPTAPDACMSSSTVCDGALPAPAPQPASSVGEAGDAYVEHLEHVMERKRTTIARLPRLPAPASRAVLRRPPDGQDRPRDVERYLHGQKRDGTVGQDGLEPPQLPARHVRVRDQARLGAAQPGRAGRPAADAALGHRRIRFLQPEELEAVLRAVPDDELGPSSGRCT